MAKKQTRAPAEPETPERYIYRATITLPSGRVLVAAHYGLKAFRIPVDGPPPANDDRK